MGAATLDAVLRGALRLNQPAQGYRATSDPLLLAGFVPRPTRRRPIDRVCDLGAGSGILGLSLALRLPSARVTLVEIDPVVALLAEENVRLNGLSDRVAVRAEDLRSIAAGPLRATFDLVVANPPYRALGRGPAPSATDLARARHEIDVTLREVVEAASLLARPSGGRVAVVLPAERSAELFALLGAAGFRLRRARFVHPRQDAPACLLLALGERAARGLLAVDPPLVLHEPDGAFTAETRRLLGDQDRGGPNER